MFIQRMHRGQDFRYTVPPYRSDKPPETYTLIYPRAHTLYLGLFLIAGNECKKEAWLMKIMP